MISCLEDRNWSIGCSTPVWSTSRTARPSSQQIAGEKNVSQKKFFSSTFSEPKEVFDDKCDREQGLGMLKALRASRQDMCSEQHRISFFRGPTQLLNSVGKERPKFATIRNLIVDLRGSDGGVGGGTVA